MSSGRRLVAASRSVAKRLRTCALSAGLFSLLRGSDSVLTERLLQPIGTCLMQPVAK